MVSVDPLGGPNLLLGKDPSSSPKFSTTGRTVFTTSSIISTSPELGTRSYSAHFTLKFYHSDELQ